MTPWKLVWESIRLAIICKRDSIFDSQGYSDEKLLGVEKEKGHVVFSAGVLGRDYWVCLECRLQKAPTHTAGCDFRNTLRKLSMLISSIVVINQVQVIMSVCRGRFYVRHPKEIWIRSRVLTLLSKN